MDAEMMQALRDDAQKLRDLGLDHPDPVFLPAPDFGGIGKDRGRGFNMATYSGTPFFPADPRPEEIHLEDIAHSLAHQCRFNGHTREFYSVAQHCVLMSLCVDPEFTAEALMHDAAEAYLGDLVRPVKALCPDWREVDSRLDAVIRERFGLPPVMSPEIAEADLRMAVTERNALIPDHGRLDWGEVPDPFPVRITPWGPETAKAAFLAYARAYGVS